MAEQLPCNTETIEHYNRLSDNALIEYNQLLKVETEIETAISKVNNNTYALLLRMKYINGMKWAEIADAVNYSENWVKNDLHNKALQEVQKNDVRRRHNVT